MKTKITVLTFTVLIALAGVSHGQGYTQQEYQKYITSNPAANPDAFGGTAAYIRHMKELDRKANAENLYENRKALYERGFISSSKMKKYEEEYQSAMKTSPDYTVDMQLIKAKQKAEAAAAEGNIKAAAADKNAQYADFDKRVLEYFSYAANAPHKAEYDTYIKEGRYNKALEKAKSINSDARFQADRDMAAYYMVRQILINNGTGALSPLLDISTQLLLGVSPSGTSKNFLEDVRKKCLNDDKSGFPHLKDVKK